MEVLEQLVLKYENRVVFEKLVLSASFKRAPKFFAEDEACFLFLDRGTFQFRTATQTLTFKEGDGMLAKCGNYYIESLNEQKNEPEVISAIGAFFYPSMIKPFFQNDLKIENFQENYDVKKISIEPLLKSFIDSISYLLSNPSLADENLIIHKLKELLLLLSKSENAQSINSFIHSLFLPHEYKFSEIVQQNLYANLSLEEYPFLTNCSLATFKRKFKELYNSSPAKYFLSEKLKYACQLLHLESKSITDIAFESGFDSITSFNKAFKRTFQQSPSQFRLSQIDK